MKYKKKKSHCLVGVSPLALAACGGGDGEESGSSISGTIKLVDQPNRSVVAWGSPGAGGDFASREQRSDILSIFSNTNGFAALTSSGEVISRGDTEEGGMYSSGSLTLTASVGTPSGVGLSGASILVIQGAVSSLYESGSGGEVSATVNGNTSVTVSANLDYLSSTKAITSQDALDSLKIAVALDPSSGTPNAFDFISADMNQDGKITSADALEILKYAVGLNVDNPSKWVFLDGNADYSNISKTNTNYSEGVTLADVNADTSISLTGILIGDVNDSYSGVDTGSSLYKSDIQIEDVQSISYFLNGGNSKSSAIFQEIAELPVDLVVMGPTDQDRTASINWEKNLIFESTEVEQIKYGSEQPKLLICYKGFGNFWPIVGAVETNDIQMTWDQNRDGIPDDNAPTWFGPVNDGWFANIENPISSTFGNWAYLDQHPEYYVRYWEDAWLSYIKSYISELAQEGWNGIFLDVVAPYAWLRGNSFTDDIFTAEELADLTYEAIGNLRSFIDTEIPGFLLLLNATELNHVVREKPEIISLSDAILKESIAFHSGEVFSSNSNPKVHSIDHLKSDPYDLTDASIFWAYDYDVPVFGIDYIENDLEAFVVYSRILNENKVISSVSNDIHFRHGPVPDIFILSGSDENDEIINSLVSQTMLIGFEGDDKLIGSTSSDLINGGSGDDIINGADGIDTAVFNYDWSAYEITKLNETSILVKTDDFFKSVHNVEIIVGGTSVLGEYPTFDLSINGNLLAASEILYAQHKNVFKYTVSDNVESITFHNTNQKYFPSEDASIVTWIHDLKVDNSIVDLGTAKFIDGKESWAGLNLWDDLVTGSGQVLFETSDYNRTPIHDGEDTLINIEILSFADQEILVSEL